MRKYLVVCIIALFTALPLPQRTARAGDWVTVRVKRGDTLSRIARKYGTTVAKLRRLNRRTLRKTLRPGMRLKVKKRTRKRHAKRGKRSKKRVAKVQRRAATETSKRRHRAKRSRSKKKGAWIIHRTRRGDTLQKLAKRYKVRVKDLRRHNRRVRKVGERKRLKRRMRLRVKKRSTHTLVGGVQLPRKGQGYKRMRPERSWGTPCTIRLIQDVYAQFAARNPGSVPGMIADISDEDGGWLPPHKSHQRGVDFDVSYYKRGNQRLRGLEVVTPDTIDIDKTWDLIRLFINTGHVDMIFMDHKLQAVLHRYLSKQGYTDGQLTQWLQYPKSRRQRQGLIRHSPGHHHHLHIRFDCVSSKDPCKRPKTALVPETRSRSKRALTKAVQPESINPKPINTPSPRPGLVDRPTAEKSAQTAKRMTSALDAIIPAKPTSPEAPAPALRRAKNPAEPRRPQAHMSSVRRPAAPSPQRSPRTRLGTRTLGDRRHGESPSRMARFGATLL